MSALSAIAAPLVAPAAIRVSPRPLLVAWTFALLLFRPSVFGEVWNEAAWVGLVGMTLAIVVFSRADLLRIGIRRWMMFLLILATTSYFLIQGLLLSSATRMVINASVVAIGSTFCILLVCHPGNVAPILKAFIWVHVLLAVSALVSLIWFASHGFNLFAAALLQTRIGAYEPYIVMPPFSLYWSWIQVFDRTAEIITAPGLPPTDVLIVADHPPPFWSHDGRAHFVSGEVPWILLRPRATDG